MTSEHRQFIATCLAAALFLVAVLSSVDTQVYAHPFSQAEIALR
jgi:hypothetical protein